MGRGAFTLIELLVVCGIIALLAAILLPALGRAREVAKSVSCMSNLHSIGLALHTYVAAYGDYYPIDYQYNNGEGEGPSKGDGLTAGYFHWTAAVEPDQYASSVFYATQNATMGTSFPPYPMQEPNYVCPSHTPHGFAPTNFTNLRIPTPPVGQVSETPAAGGYAAVDDRQAPRLSYIANEAIMPRKKYCVDHDNNYLSTYNSYADPLTQAAYSFANYDVSGTYNWNNTSNLCQVQEDEITSPATTILVAEFSQNPACIYGTSVGGGLAYKSHRPVNAVKIASAQHMTGPEVNGLPTPAAADFRLFDGEEYDTNQQWQFYKLTVTDAMNDINCVTNGTTTFGKYPAAAYLDHITYIDPNAHLTGSNYLFVDGHAAQYTLSATLDPNNYLWGSNMWSVVNKPVIQNATADNPAIPTGTVVPTYQ
jgi:prepilin-type processing-associated H-X9-DG protein/prepilin-type N-terminal cleavage/methylation domain-containing protein